MIVKYLPFIAVAGVLAYLLSAATGSAETSAQFVYRVSHSTFGEIGSYANTIQPTRDTRSGRRRCSS